MAKPPGMAKGEVGAPRRPPVCPPRRTLAARRVGVAVVVAAGVAVGLSPMPAAADIAPGSPSGSADRAAVAPDWPAVLKACAERRLDAERLACFDEAAREAGLRATTPGATPGATSGADTAGSPRPAWGSGTLPASPPAGSVEPGGYLSAFWELEPQRKRGTFNFIGYRPNYFLPLHVTSQVNRLPTSPNPANAASVLPPYRSVGAKVQLSIRTKIVQGLFLPGADLWFGYTQQSLWQLYSSQISAPFRSTDHEPELLYVVPLPAPLPWGWSLRMGGLGVAHQSNGQALPLSRSWNRVYAMAGVERGEFALLGRLNQRLSEDPDTNDNPDLVSFRGRLDLLAAWTPGLATATLQWRTNLADRRGSLQLDWTFPVDRERRAGLRYYLQAFTGYTETLLDYNFRQTSLGAGVTLFGW